MLIACLSAHSFIYKCFGKNTVPQNYVTAASVFFITRYFTSLCSKESAVTASLQFRLSSFRTYVRDLFSSVYWKYVVINNVFKIFFKNKMLSIVTRGNLRCKPRKSFAVFDVLLIIYTITFDKWKSLSFERKLWLYFTMINVRDFSPYSSFRNSSARQ